MTLHARKQKHSIQDAVTSCKGGRETGCEGGGQTGGEGVLCVAEASRPPTSQAETSV